MPKKTSQSSPDPAEPPKLPKPSASARPKASPPPALKRPLPAASVARAKKAFKGFSLSRFARDATPSNYVAPGQSPAEVQRQVISKHIDKLKTADGAQRSMTIALPVATIKQLLPSFDTKAGTVDLKDVLSLIQNNMGGTEFYAHGNPTLNRLTVQAQVQQIIDSIKNGAKK